MIKRNMVRILAILATCVQAAAQTPAAPPPAMAKPVGVVTVRTEAVPFSVTVPGRAVAYEQALIRPRVEGIVEEIPYVAGKPVAVGDVLFGLEDESYAATLAAAEADVSRAEAALRAAELTLERDQRLVGTSITQEALETAQVAQMEALADLKTAQAAQQVAQLQLDRTQIRSPIAGIADVASVSVGALVTANQTEALTTVTRIDPIFVDVAEPSVRMLGVRQKIEDGTLTRGDTVAATLTLENGEVYGAAGTINSPGVLVSQTTGTVNFRVQFPNPDHKILPGQFLRLDIELGTTQGILVPQRATSRDATGALTAFVVRDGKAVQVTLAEAGSHANAWIVTAGLAPGDQVIVDGLKNLRDGVDVTPVAVTLGADGLVQTAAGE